MQQLSNTEKLFLVSMAVILIIIYLLKSGPEYNVSLKTSVGKYQFFPKEGFIFNTTDGSLFRVVLSEDAIKFPCIGYPADTPDDWIESLAEVYAEMDERKTQEYPH